VGAGVVIFGTCLYVGAAAFIREFQGSAFYDESQKLGSLGTEEKNFVLAKITPINRR